MPDFRDYFTSEALNPPRLLEEVKLMARKFAWDPEHWRFRAEEARTVADGPRGEVCTIVIRSGANIKLITIGVQSSPSALAGTGYDEIGRVVG